MVKAYLRYEQIQAFGVIASATAPIIPLPNPSNQPLIASAAGDAIAVWNLRTGLTTALLGNVSTRKSGLITSLTSTVDGTALAAGYSDGTIRLWRYQKQVTSAFDDEEPVPTFTMSAHRSGVSALSFEVDGSSLVSGSNDGDLILWNVSDGTGRFRAPAHNDAVTAVLVVSRDDGNVIISASKDGLMKVYDITTQHCLQTVVGHHAEIWAMAYDPTENLVLTGSVDAEIRGFVVEMRDDPVKNSVTGLGVTERVLKSIGSVQRSMAANRVASVAFTRVHDVLFAIVAGADKSIDIFRVRPAESALNRSKKRAKRKAAEEKNRDGEDVKQDTENKQLRKNNEKDDEVKAELRDYLISLRNLRLKSKPYCVTTLPKGMPLLRDKSSEPELLLLIQTRSNAIELHGAELSGAGVEKSRKKGKRPRTGTGVIKLGEVKKHMALDKEGHRKAPRSIALSRDGNTLLSTGDGHLNVWNVATRSCIRSMEYSDHGVSALLIGAEGYHAIVGSKSGALSLFDVRTGNLLFEAPDAHAAEIWSMCLDGETYDANLLITGSADKKVRFWDVSEIHLGKLTLVKTMEHGNEVLCVRAAYQREKPVLLVSLTDNTVRAYILETLEPYLSFYGHRLPVLSMDVSSDGEVLATGSADKTLKLWGLDFGDLRRSLRAHQESVLSVMFQPNTHYIFTSSRDGTMKYWDGDKFELITDIEGVSGEIRCVCTSGDGEIIASASDDRLIRAWRRTDEPLFLEEMRDQRLDSMFEQSLLDDDERAARADRVHGKSVVGDVTAETERVQRRTLEGVKAAEGVLEALRLCKEENLRDEHERALQPNPLLLGLSPDAYMLRQITRIKSGSLEDALQMLPLDAAVSLLVSSIGLLECAGVDTETVVRVCLTLCGTHHSQITGGAMNRAEVSKLWKALKKRLTTLHRGFGLCIAGLEFCSNEIKERRVVQ